jgi:hypothetical protein
MVKRITRWLDIHDKEISLFLWTLALLFIVRSAGILLNNYAETAFLKRYGVEFMPVVNMINAFVTVVVMGIMAGLMQRFPGPNLLSAMFLFTGGSIMGVRLLIPFGFDLIYPLLFMLKALYEVLLAMLFWNLANDLFNTRQSKRLFPLITAGGVVGQILGSFGTPLLVRWFQFDNLLVIYLVVSAAGSALVWAMMHRFPALLMAEPTAAQIEKRGRSMREELKTIWPMMKESILLRVMIILTLMPNVVIPIMNYQFNYAVDRTFVTETALVSFFGYFRGVMNIISLVILLFVGRIYSRFGLPVALMFHPLNYAFAFTAFVLRFDIFSAIYARMSTQILRTTINIPANAVVMGLFPESFRAMVRPFLRGSVVRIGLFVGSALILIGDRLFHPRYLSLVALPFVLVWLAAPFILKRRYAAILSDLIKGNQIDLKSMEANEMAPIFRERSAQSELIRAFSAAEGREAVWYAQLMKRVGVSDIDRLLMQKIRYLRDDLKIEMLLLLSPNADATVSQLLTVLAARQHPALTLAVLQTVHRLGRGPTAGFDRRPYLSHEDVHLRAYAAGALYAQAPVTARQTIQRWLKAGNPQTRKAGVIAAGLTQDALFEPILTEYLNDPRHSALLPEIIEALHAVGQHEMNPALNGLLRHSDARIRQAALSAFHVVDKESLNSVITLLGDADSAIRTLAARRIEEASFQDGKTLIKALSTPNKEMRECLFDLLDRLQIKDVDLYRFARDQIEGAYKYMAESQGVRAMDETPSRQLLIDYLDQQKQVLIENVLRGLAIGDRTGRMRIIARGLFSTDARQRANSQEAVDNLLDRSLSKILLPLLDDIPPAQALAIGRKQFKIPHHTRDTTGLCTHLLHRRDWLTVLLTLQYIGEMPDPPVAVDEALCAHDNPHIRLVAKHLVHRISLTADTQEHSMVDTLTLPKIILWLKKIEIFEQLAVNELSAVAAVTEQVTFAENEQVINEGDAGDTLYLIIEGEVVVLKRQEDGQEVELDRMGAGDSFGEMALFEDIPRSATIRSVRPSRMLVLHKQEFKEIVHEYPQIALGICKALSSRIRKLHRKMMA